jgi:hypothetical protein
VQTTYYCSINGQTYNSQEVYNANCINRASLYCSLNGQTYTSQQAYADGCKKYCSINTYYYASQSDFDRYCVAPTPTFYCAINGQTYNSQFAYDINCKNSICNIGEVYFFSGLGSRCACPVGTIESREGLSYSQYKCVNPVQTTYYCSINGQTYNSQEVYNANCINRASLYCSLNGQTYTSQQAYADGCKKYCSINRFYYATQNEFDNYCKAPVQTFYCTINGQTYNSQEAYNHSCVASVVTYFCTLNSQTYNSQSAYNAGCRLYCTYNTYYYNTQNEYNNLCKAPISLYCALNGQTYSSNQAYANGCKKYCSINGFYYATQNEFDNYCKAPVTPVWYCTINTRTYYSQNDYNNNCRNIAPVVVNHRVITTVPTQITKTSAKCNGVAMIANGVNTTGYFEYGTSANLGYNTNSGNIGNQSNTQYSNLITGLKSDTTYYCRAVMTNINGTYRGELMSFRTGKEVVNYIPVVTAPKPAAPKKVTAIVKGKKVVKYVAPKVDKGGIDITCKDIEGNQSVIKSGQKLAAVNFEKISGDIKKGSVVDYKLSYKNTSDKLTLSNVIVKVTAPKDMTFVDKSIGEYDAIENSLTIEDARVKSGETVEKIIKMQVADTVTANKSLIVNSYLSYEVLDTKGGILKDEVTNYSVLTVADNSKEVADDKMKADSKSATNGSIIPGTVLEWIAIIALIMVLFILGRVIFKDMMGTKSEVNHH